MIRFEKSSHAIQAGTTKLHWIFGLRAITPQG